MKTCTEHRHEHRQLPCPWPDCENNENAAELVEVPIEPNRPIAKGPGRYDGIEVLPGGRILVSAWNDSTVSEIVGERLRPLIRGVSAAADIGVDPVAGMVAIPLLREDRVEFWRLGK